MKVKIISMLLVFLLGVSISGCSNSNLGNISSTSSSSNVNSASTTNSNSNISSTNSNNIPNSSVPPSPSSSSSNDKNKNTNNQVLTNNFTLEAYKAVLQNKAEFFSTDNKKSLYLNDFLSNKEIYGTIFKVTHFTVLDMDGDNKPEVVLELSVGGEPQFYEILHYMNSVVHGYLIVYRGLEELKADGTFHFSNSAADNGWGKLSFEPNAPKTDMLGYSKSSQNGANLTITYLVNNKLVTKESFDSFSKEQSEKKNATWYEFSQKNIETELSANP
ncbi:hypothetical protein [Candidatus Clostridium stratigraminis]|uniref:Lipoprotein n=1 Tax=Candidatus Clostridium stratigraminis TaxID=3381661 RepID=A0ABW8T3F5_9CLOT